MTLMLKVLNSIWSNYNAANFLLYVLLEGIDIILLKLFRWGIEGYRILLMPSRLDAFV